LSDYSKINNELVTIKEKKNSDTKNYNIFKRFKVHPQMYQKWIELDGNYIQKNIDTN